MDATVAHSTMRCNKLHLWDLMYTQRPVEAASGLDSPKAVVLQQRFSQCIVRSGGCSPK